MDRSRHRAVEIDDRWIGSECSEDADCNYAGGFCRAPDGLSRGTCTQSCVKGPDRAGEATTFCVPDPATKAGICVPKASQTFNNTCARHETRLGLEKAVARPDKSETADVCRPPE